MVTAQGCRHKICGGGYTAVIAEVGASLVSLVDPDGRHLVLPTPEEGLREGCSGAVLAPWPNRIRDGRYEFGGETHQLPITEPERRVAAHGLTLWERWDLDREATDGSRVVFRLDLVPQPGYPFSLVLTCTYLLDERGLTWTVQARNTGDLPAPYAVAGHPYLTPPTPPEMIGTPRSLDGWRVHVPAEVFQEVDEERLLPAPHHPRISSVAGTPFDLGGRGGCDMAGRQIDLALGQLRRNNTGEARCWVQGPDGAKTVLTCGPAVEWIQIYTDDQAGEGRGRRAVALEPMSAPADTFNSGTSLKVLRPGALHEMWWRIGS